MNWQRIFNGILSNLHVVVVVLVALSSVVKGIASAARKSREERAKKLLLERAKYEQLRTGRVAERSMLPADSGIVTQTNTISNTPARAPRPIDSADAERKRRIEELRRRQAVQRPGSPQPPRPQQPGRQEAPRRVQLPGGVVVDTSRPRQAPAKPTRQTTPASRPQSAPPQPQPERTPATGSSAVASALRQAQTVQAAGAGIVPARGDAGARGTPAGRSTFLALGTDPAQRRKALRDAVILSEVFGQPASAR